MAGRMTTYTIETVTLKDGYSFIARSRATNTVYFRSNRVFATWDLATEAGTNWLQG